MKFRKKPIVIEAEQYTHDGPLPFVEGDSPVEYNEDGSFPYVMTLEGPLRVSDGDWIIRGIKHEYYPCKPDIFEATYETVEDSERQIFEEQEQKIDHLYTREYK